ncbi:hypothetical protein BDN72DRAFT_948157 [Pluteus cervinus]|uniref:Uncharacterized protein n=1 Tax=Pluteus cervinus TaxID=181527 RepID=A0ACD2ZZP9_9AGAR|nr:hypothetical protein BDN72DRAFT_948157 [Pluteus cervinus]
MKVNPRNKTNLPRVNVGGNSGSRSWPSSSSSSLTTLSALLALPAASATTRGIVWGTEIQEKGMERVKDEVMNLPKQLAEELERKEEWEREREREREERNEKRRRASIRIPLDPGESEPSSSIPLALPSPPFCPIPVPPTFHRRTLASLCDLKIHPMPITTTQFNNTGSDSIEHGSRLTGPSDSVRVVARNTLGPNTSLDPPLLYRRARLGPMTCPSRLLWRRRSRRYSPTIHVAVSREIYNYFLVFVFVVFVPHVPSSRWSTEGTICKSKFSNRFTRDRTASYEEEINIIPFPIVQKFFEQNFTTHPFNRNIVIPYPRVGNPYQIGALERQDQNSFADQKLGVTVVNVSSENNIRMPKSSPHKVRESIQPLPSSANKEPPSSQEKRGRVPRDCAVSSNYVPTSIDEGTADTVAKTNFNPG